MKNLNSGFGMKALVNGSSFWAIILALTWLGLSGGSVMAQGAFTKEFRLEDCAFIARGANPHFSLRTGYQLVLEGEEDGEDLRVVISVLPEFEEITLPNIGTVRTRVVEERESVGDNLIEVSRNFYARCGGTNDVFYFGEDVDICEDGLVEDGDGFLCNGEEPSHDGAWRAGEPDDDGLAEPGIIFPGTFLLGSRYFQEIADGIALDRARHVRMGLEVTTEAGTFNDCVRVRETTPLEPDDVSIKVYCPGVGIVIDDVVELVEFGFNIFDNE